jgi:hypothetical protein
MVFVSVLDLSALNTSIRQKEMKQQEAEDQQKIGLESTHIGRENKTLFSRVVEKPKIFPVKTVH